MPHMTALTYSHVRMDLFFSFCFCAMMFTIHDVWMLHYYDMYDALPQRQMRWISDAGELRGDGLQVE
jgi:hypothetical protein